MPARPLLVAALLLSPTAWADTPTLYGRYENVRIEEVGKTFKAKMDTGAMTASLSAKDIERFERDGEDWVRFRLATEDADDTVFEQPLARMSKIKTRTEERDPDDDDDSERGSDVATRPVIDMEICLGDERREIEVNLTDRSRFRYPLLIGATAIRELDGAIDPSRKYTADRPSC